MFGIVIDHTSSEEFMGEKFKYFMIKKNRDILNIFINGVAPSCLFFENIFSCTFI